MYNIIRFYQNGNRVIIEEDVTLEEAQEHCSDTETSSSTCSSGEGDCGPWFDGYYKN